MIPPRPSMACYSGPASLPGVQLLTNGHRRFMNGQIHPPATIEWE